MTQPLRFLLDQGFPVPRFDVHSLDRTVTYEHFSSYAPKFSSSSTPDWMLHLLAAEGGFDGVVTPDRSQLEEETELVALALSRVTVVTWTRGDEDPVVLWGQLLAYMPQVRKIMSEHPSVVITLPNPRLPWPKSATTPRDMLGAMKQQDGVDFPQRKRRAVKMMERELRTRDQTQLMRHLQDS